MACKEDEKFNGITRCFINLLRWFTQVLRIDGQEFLRKSAIYDSYHTWKKIIWI